MTEIKHFPEILPEHDIYYIHERKLMDFVDMLLEILKDPNTTKSFIQYNFIATEEFYSNGKIT